MNERKNNRQDEEEKGDMKEVFYFEDDDEEEIFIDYYCVDCGCIDPVPEFIVAECAYDLEPGESPEFFCPECNGTLVRKEKPAEE
ncbi:hypothetical protein [Paenibacillus sp. HB172176]|uniref:hypothetical protein n=1 Tax=Paenibacillus sp. HB172176 TaxID=2493690 RepID=UPI00143A4720|nr:hypothetical protein [Paenibacillus sp. HB172176]